MSARPVSAMVHRGRVGVVAALAAALLSACGGHPGSADSASPVKQLRVVADRVDGRSLLAADAGRAIVAGAGKLSLVGADVASEGDRVGAFVEIPADECALAFARTTPTISDVDLYAFEDDGDAFASDESPDADPAILMCPPHPRRLYVVARVMSGAGILSVGVQRVPRASADAVAKAMNARGRPGDESGRLEAWPGLEAKVNAHRAQLGARWEDVRRVAMPVDPHVASRVSVNVEPGRCVDVLITPSDEVPSLDVVAEDAGGRVVARARDRGRDRTLLLCAAMPVELSLTVRPRGSAGLVAVVVGRSAVGGEAEISAPSRIERITQTLELPDARAAHERRVAGKGFGAAKTIATGSAKVGVRTTVPLDLPAGCARVDIVGGKPLVSLGTELWDEHGALLAEDRGGATATLFTCGPGRRARADVEALARPGPFAIELRADKAAPPALVANPVAAARLLGRLDAGGDVADATVAAAAKPVVLESGKQVTVPFVTPATGCAEVVVALDSGGTGVDLRLMAAGTRDGPVGRARYVVSDRLCGAGAAKNATAELRLSSGKANALVLVRNLP